MFRLFLPRVYILPHVYNLGPAWFRRAVVNLIPSLTMHALRDMTDVNVHGAFALARAAVEAFQKNALDARGKRGTLIFTGATGSLRGNVTTSAFSAGKFALRSLSQSLSKEFGKENIHVSGRFGTLWWKSELIWVLGRSCHN